MNIEQLYTGCLSQGAYFIESEGEAAVIDPLRETSPYLELAQERNVTIKYIFETHFHADFVSGHVALAGKTGAPIVYGPLANPDFEAIIAQDGQEFQLGAVRIKVLHTPGHTMESTTYLLIDEAGEEHAIFSGDTLFLGDVGRPDLAQKAANMSQEELAGTLFDSLRTKIMTLPGDTIVYPGHGAGSACGKNLSKETIGTLADQKATNYALRADMSREEFIQEVTQGLLPPPAYFPLNVQLNKQGASDLGSILEKGKNALSPEEFEQAANQTGALVLDVRHQSEYAQGHIPRSIFIGLDGSFAPWVGALVRDIQQPILLVAPEGRLKEAITRLSRVGFDQVLGYLKGGFEAWQEAGRETDSVTSIPASEFALRSTAKPLQIVDVRKQSEFSSEHVVNAQNTPLDELVQHLGQFQTEALHYIHCAGGYRSMIACSILKSHGIHNLIDVRGGMSAIKQTATPLSNFVCPSTL